MKNREVIALFNGGFMEATAHCLPAEEFYKWHKFRMEINRLLQQYAIEQKSLAAECNVIIGQEDKADKESRKRYEELSNKLLEEQVQIALPSKIPYRFFKEIYDENKNKSTDIFANIAVETLVLNAIFTEINAE